MLKDAFGSIYLISTATGRIERVLKGHTNVIFSLAFAVPPGGRLLLASGSGDKTARIWDVATGECRRSPRGTHEQRLRCCLRSRCQPAGHCVVRQDGADLVGGRRPVPADPPGAYEGGQVRCLEPRWETPGHRRLRWVDPTLEPGRNPLPRNIENLDNWINSVIFTADSSELLYTWGGRTLPVGSAVLQVSSGQERVRFTKHRQLSSREPSLPTARWRPRRGAIPTKSTSGDCLTLHPYTAWPARGSPTGPPAGARTASRSPGATHPRSPRTTTGAPWSGASR